MSIITDIKQKIKTIGPGEFQELCDVLLEKMHPNWNIHELGMQSGTGKTTRGNPDTYFRIEGGDLAGKYVFVAYTTQCPNIFKKIREDLEKCLAECKEPLSKKDLAIIIVCHTSDNLKANEDKQLHELCGEIPLEILGIDQISNLIYNRYPLIANDILHIPFSSGQLLDIDAFINDSDSNGLSAPLKTPFLFREKTCEEILNSLDENQYVILTGKPGVGKTRLAIEICRKYSEVKKFKLICIRNNGVLLQKSDFFRWMDQDGSYIILIDDANDTEQLRELIGYQLFPNNVNVHFVMTVRDYAKDIVEKAVSAVDDYKVYEILPFNDSEITEFIKTVFNIQEQHYVDQIIRIAEGNPRIAYLAGRMACNNDLAEIYDFSKLLDRYYNAAIDKYIGNDESLCITSGILATIHAVSLNNLTNLEEVFQNRIIDKQSFIQCCRKLVNIEVAEDHYSTILLSDQCFSNYMVYYTFFKRKLIPFSEMLDIGFRSFRENIVQSTNVIVNIFNNSSVSDYLKAQVKIVWDRFKNSGNSSLFEDFSEIYHLFFPDESLLIAKAKINAFPQESIPISIDYNKKMHDSTDHVLNLLQHYETLPDYLESAMELALQYAQKSELNFVKYKQWFNECFEINEDSQISDFQLQKTAIAFMKKHCTDNIHLSELFLAIGSEWLTFEFNPISMGRNHSIRVYHIVYQYSPEIAEYRNSIFEMILTVANQACYQGAIHNDLLKMLHTYAQHLQRGMDQKIVQTEAPYIEKILSNLNNDLAKAIVVNELLEAFSLPNCEIPWNLDFSTIFSVKSWKEYSVFSKEYVFNDVPYEKFNHNREKQIEEYAKGLRPDDMQSLVINLEQCISVGSNYCFSAPQTINDSARILCDVISNDHELSIAFLRSVQRNGRKIHFRPSDIFKKEIERDNQWFYQFITNEKYASPAIRNDWQYLYFSLLFEEQCNQWSLDNLMLFLKDDNDRLSEEYFGRNLSFLLNFRKIQSDIFPVVSKLLLEKQSYSVTLPMLYFDSLFHEGFIDEFSPDGLLTLFQDNIAVLKEVYFFEIQNSNGSDYDGKYLACFLQHDHSWINCYCDYLFNNKNQKLRLDYEPERLEALWKMDGYELLFDTIFEYAMSTNNTTTLFYNKNLLRRLFGHYSNDKKVTERQKDWYLHLVRTNALSSQLKYVFFMCCDLEDSFRLQMFQSFLTLNQNFDDFQKLPVFPPDLFVSGSFVPAYEKRINFLNRLRSLLSDVRFLEHRCLVNEMIEDLKQQITEKKASDAFRKANGW